MLTPLPPDVYGIIYLWYNMGCESEGAIWAYEQQAWNLGEKIYIHIPFYIFINPHINFKMCIKKH